MNSFLRRYSFAWMVLLGILGGGVTGAAEERTQVVGSDEAIILAVAHNPSLKAALLSVAGAEAALRTEEGRYPLVLEADTGYTHASTPLGHSLYQSRDTVSTGVGLSKTLNVGTSLNLRLDGEWTDADTAPETTVYPTWGAGARLSVVQPLLRGFGKRVGDAPLRQASAAKGVSEKSTLLTAGNLAAEVLSAYWSLWLALKTVEINQASRDTAKAQLDEITTRVALGDAAVVDKLAYETRLSSLEETVIESESTVRRLQVALAAKVGVIREARALMPRTTEPLPTWDEVPALEGVIEDTLSSSPAIDAAEAAVSVEEERLRVAGESDRQRLDVEGWIEARTLGADDVGPVVTDLAKRDVLSGYVGVVYELPLDKRKRDGERAVARINVESAAERLAAERMQGISDAATAHADLVAAGRRVDSARKTLDLATAEVEAQRERYRLGAALFTDVRDAEESLREASLRLRSAEIDVVLAQIEIDRLRGALLKRLGKRFSD